MLSIRDALAQANQLNSDSARLDVELLLCHLLQKNRSWLFTWPEKTLDTVQEAEFQQLFARRLAGEPVAHITGQRDFWSLTLKVNSSTLIPRPDTETLVEWALTLALPEQAKVLDLGTGTGAIALALAVERPCWTITATDINPDAVQLARVNAVAHQLHVNVMTSRWFESISPQQFDLIVSNPPYIPADDPHLAQGDVRFEPHSALVADHQGLGDIQRICTGARSFLATGGWLGIEHGFDQAKPVQEIFTRAGFDAVRTVEDLAGQPRITVGQFSG